jgi:hypothetical protein
MNALWESLPALLTAYDRYALRSFIAHRARGLEAIVCPEEESDRYEYSPIELWILVACIGVRAHAQCRANTVTNASISILLDLPISLLRSLGAGRMAQCANHSKWATAGEYFRWFGTTFQERRAEYSAALEADATTAANRPYFGFGNFTARVLERVLCERPGRDKKYSLRALEISDFLLLEAYPSFLRVLSEPSFSRFALAWYVNALDSFWVAYRPDSASAP